MKLVLLGTAGYHPSDHRHTACLALPELGLVFDAGTALYRLPDYLQTEQLHIFLSHAHLDHVIGLTFLFSFADTIPPDRLDRIVVHAETEKLDAIRQHLFAELLFPVKPPFRMEPLDGTFHLSGGGTLNYFPLLHPGGSVGYRLDLPDRSFAYVTDTTATPDADYVQHIRGVDLLVHEAYFTADDPDMIHKTGHSHTQAVAEVAHAAQVKRLLLVHLNPLLRDDNEIELPKIRRIFPRTDIAHDRLEVDF